MEKTQFRYITVHIYSTGALQYRFRKVISTASRINILNLGKFRNFLSTQLALKIFTDIILYSKAHYYSIATVFEPYGNPKRSSTVCVCNRKKLSTVNILNYKFPFIYGRIVGDMFTRLDL